MTAGGPVRFTRVALDGFTAGEEDNVAELMRYRFTEVLDGRNVATAGAWA